MEVGPKLLGVYGVSPETAVPSKIEKEQIAVRHVIPIKSWEHNMYMFSKRLALQNLIFIPISTGINGNCSLFGSIFYFITCCRERFRYRAKPYGQLC